MKGNDLTYAQATGEAELLGVCTCRTCKHKYALTDCITIFFGGGLVFALCMECAKTDEIVICRNEKSIQVFKRSTSKVIAIGSPRG